MILIYKKNTLEYDIIYNKKVIGGLFDNITDFDYYIVNGIVNKSENLNDVIDKFRSYINTKMEVLNVG